MDDQGQTTKQPASVLTPVADGEATDEPALAAVTEIAAKIKANLEAQGASLEKEPATEEDSNFNDLKNLIPVEDSSSGTKDEIRSPKNESSLLKSFGIKVDDEKAAKKPKLSDLTVLQKLDINDTRHRYYLSKASTQQEVEKEFDVTIITKGKYCPDRRLATEKDPALYLEIHGKTDEDVEKAVVRLGELIENGPVLQAAPQSSQVSFRHIYLLIPTQC